MVAVIATLLSLSSIRPNPDMAMYKAFEHRVKLAPSIVVVADNGATYRYMHRRYRYDSPNLTIICDGHQLYRSAKGKQTERSKAPSEMPNELWLRCFEGLTGNAHFSDVQSSKVQFGGRTAIELDATFNDMPRSELKLYFDAALKLPLGYRDIFHQDPQDSIEEVHFTKVSLNAHLKPSDFTIPRK